MWIHDPTWSRHAYPPPSTWLSGKSGVRKALGSKVTSRGKTLSIDASWQVYYCSFIWVPAVKHAYTCHYTSPQMRVLSRLITPSQGIKSLWAPYSERGWVYVGVLQTTCATNQIRKITVGGHELTSHEDKTAALTEYCTSIGQADDTYNVFST